MTKEIESTLPLYGRRLKTLGMSQDEVSYRLSLGLGERTRAGILYATRGDEGTIHREPTGIPLITIISVEVNPHSPVAIVPPVLSPEAIMDPGILIAIRVHEWDEPDIGALQNRANFRGHLCIR